MAFRSAVRSKLLALCGGLRADPEAIIRPAPATADALDDAILTIAARVLKRSQFNAFCFRYLVNDSDKSGKQRLQGAYSLMQFSENPASLKLISRNSNRALERLLDVVSSGKDECAAILRSLDYSTEPNTHSEQASFLARSGGARDQAGRQPVSIEERRLETDTKTRVDRYKAALERNAILGQLPAVALDALAARGQHESFKKGALIYRRGDPGDSLLMVIGGRVRISNTIGSGREVALHFVTEGEIFGEIGVLDGKDRDTDAIALEDSDIFFIPIDELLPELTSHPTVLLEVIRFLCERIRVSTAIIEDNALEMRSRTARGLLRLARQIGRPGADGRSLQITISQTELGNHFQMSRANVNRELARLKLAKLIAISGTGITILDEGALAELASSSD